MKTPKQFATAANLPPSIDLPETQHRKRRLGKRLFLIVIGIAALVTITLALLVTQVPPTGTLQMEWSQTYYGYSGHAIQTSDGGYAIAGTNATLLFYPASERAPTLIKTDASGNLLWNRTFETTGHVATTSILQTKDGGYLLSGTNIALPITNPVYNGWLTKTDSYGTLQWTKTLGLPLQTCSAIQGSDGGFIVVGYASNEANGANAVLCKVDAQGTLLWTKIFGGNSSKLLAMRLAEADSDGYVIAGAFDHDGWLAKTDSGGNLQWSKRLHEGGLSTFPFLSIAKASDGGYILAGGNVNNGLLVKVDSAANLEWYKLYPSSKEQMLLLHSAMQLSDRGYVAVGAFSRQAYVIRTDAAGTMLSAASYGNVAANISSSAVYASPSKDGGFVVSGTLNQYSPTSAEGFHVTLPVNTHVWLAKFPVQTTAP